MKTRILILFCVLNVVPLLGQNIVCTNGQKYCLLEEITGAWCQYCPDGSVIMEQVLINNSRAIGGALHSSDKMQSPDQYYLSGWGGQLTCSAPSALINRGNWNGTYTPCGSDSDTHPNDIKKSYWDQLVNQQITMTPKWDITLEQVSYNPLSRTVTLKITAKSLVLQSGDYNVNIMILEDSVTGPNITGYNQQNAYNTVVNHPYYGAGNPIIGFVHRHVIRKYLGGVWGTTGVIPANAPLNGTYSYIYTYTIPNNYDSLTSGSPLTNINHIYFTGMVIKNTSSKYDREIMNCIQTSLDPNFTGIADENFQNEVRIFPNPFSASATLQISDSKSFKNIELKIVDLCGREVWRNYLQVTATGSFETEIEGENLLPGIYFLQVKNDKWETTKKIAIH